MKPDLSNITNPEARSFVKQFLRNRQINREFYRLVPEDKFDFRMVNTMHRKSDSPRESLIHQIDVTRDYINGVKTGILKFNIKYKDINKLLKLSKSELLSELEKGEQDLIKVLSDGEIGNTKVKVPWMVKLISAVSSLWGLNSHEILHTGWNLALMDHLNIKRFPSLREMWG